MIYLWAQEKENECPSGNVEDGKDSCALYWYNTKAQFQLRRLQAERWKQRYAEVDALGINKAPSATQLASPEYVLL